MNVKLAFGIIIPIIMIFTLGILGSLSIGFVIDKDYNSEINYSRLSSTSYSSQAFKIGTVNIENDYFLSRKYELPSLVTCLLDEEREVPLVQAGTVFYNEGDKKDNSGDFNIIELSKAQSSRYYSYNYRSSPVSVELSPNSEKELILYYSPQYYYDSTSNSAYDYLLIVEQKSDKYLSCSSLTSEQIESAKRIKINKEGQGYCYSLTSWASQGTFIPVCDFEATLHVNDNNYNDNSGSYKIKINSQDLLVPGTSQTGTSKIRFAQGQNYNYQISQEKITINSQGSVSDYAGNVNPYYDLSQVQVSTSYSDYLCPNTNAYGLVATIYPSSNCPSSEDLIIFS